MSAKLIRQSLAPRLIAASNVAPATVEKPISAPSRPRQVSSRTLLGSESSLVINHEGVSYILRATRLGKLILTK